ncbi:MAG: hypothetical protein WC455_23995 [Dehalococcoidia bacterium]|jgi:hypothetical protein
MDEFFVMLWIMVAMALVAILSPIFLHNPYSLAHPVGLNVTPVENDLCKFTWLGGIDYDSFVRDIDVNGKSIGHPKPYTVIHIGDCNSTIRLYFIDVKTYLPIWPNEVKHV